MCVETDPSAGGVGLESVLDLQEAFDHIAPSGLPLEGPRLAMPLENLGLRVKNLSGIAIIGRVRPEVLDRARYEHLIVLLPQKEIAGRGHAARAGAEER